MSGICYSKIVFGLKHYQRLYDCWTVNELIHSLRIIITEHDAVTDICERPGLHYHGIIEYENNTDDYKTLHLLRSYCAYFKIETCDNPEQFVMELVLPPKKIMIMNITKSLNLQKYYSNISVAVTRLEPNDLENKDFQREALKFIISCISDRKSFDPAEILKEINESCFSTMEQLETIVMRSIDLMQQKMLDLPILELCKRFRNVSENYYSVDESTILVVEWCQYQNINFEDFAMNIINCFDKRISLKNSLYFEGSSESGVLNIIDSILEACFFIGEVYNESTGYTYVWEECLEKRCIIMRNPNIDVRMLEEVENIFKGIGTLVPHRQNILKYLRPTPIILICDETDEENNLHLQCLQTFFVASYVNLKPFEKLNGDQRRLHPGWLNVLYMYFAGNNIDYNTNCCEDNLRLSMNVDISCEMTEEISEENSLESISRASSGESYPI